MRLQGDVTRAAVPGISRSQAGDREPAASWTKWKTGRPSACCRRQAARTTAPPRDGARQGDSVLPPSTAVSTVSRGNGRDPAGHHRKDVRPAAGRGAGPCSPESAPAGRAGARRLRPRAARLQDAGAAFRVCRGTPNRLCSSPAFREHPPGRTGCRAGFTGTSVSCSQWRGFRRAVPTSSPSPSGHDSPHPVSLSRY